MLSTLPATRSPSGSTRGFATIDPERQGVPYTARLAQRTAIAFTRQTVPAAPLIPGQALLRPEREAPARHA